jgi:hypothetical protein
VRRRTPSQSRRTSPPKSRRKRRLTPPAPGTTVDQAAGTPQGPDDRPPVGPPSNALPPDDERREAVTTQARADLTMIQFIRRQRAHADPWEWDFAWFWWAAEIFHERDLREDLLKIEAALNERDCFLKTLLPWPMLSVQVDQLRDLETDPIPTGRLRPKWRLTAAMNSLVNLVKNPHVADRLKLALRAEHARLTEERQALPSDSRRATVHWGGTEDIALKRGVARKGWPPGWADYLRYAYGRLLAHGFSPNEACKMLHTVVVLLLPQWFRDTGSDSLDSLRHVLRRPPAPASP